MQHYERRLEAMDGKAMIVCLSRRICVDLYNAIIKLRRDWASAQDDDSEAEKKQACVAKIVMTGSADDGPDWQPHIRNKARRRELANRFKESARARIKVMVKRILKKHGYPRDLQDEATKTVLAPAELLSAVWALT